MAATVKVTLNSLPFGVVVLPKGGVVIACRLTTPIPSKLMSGLQRLPLPGTAIPFTHSENTVAGFPGASKTLFE